MAGLYRLQLPRATANAPTQEASTPTAHLDFELTRGHDLNGASEPPDEKIEVQPPYRSAESFCSPSERSSMLDSTATKPKLARMSTSEFRDLRNQELIEDQQRRIQEAERSRSELQRQLQEASEQQARKELDYNKAVQEASKKGNTLGESDLRRRLSDLEATLTERDSSSKTQREELQNLVRDFLQIQRAQLAQQQRNLLQQLSEVLAGRKLDKSYQGPPVVPLLQLNGSAAGGSTSSSYRAKQEQVLDQAWKDVDILANGSQGRVAATDLYEAAIRNADSAALAPGTPVKAKYLMKTMELSAVWYSANVRGQNEDGTYQLIYKDGATWDRAPRACIQVVETVAQESGPDQMQTNGAGVVAVAPKVEAEVSRVAPLKMQEASADVDDGKKDTESSTQDSSKVVSPSFSDGHATPAAPLTPLQRIATHDYFDLFFGACILVNCVVMAVELQHNGKNLGVQIDYPMVEKSPDWIGVLLEVCGVFLLIVFIIELGTKMAAFKLRFFCSGWNILDFIIVSLGILDYFKLIDAFDPTMIRLLRLAKLLRFLKMAKMASFLDVLNLLLKSIWASLSTLFWSMLLLFMIQWVYGMFLQQLAMGYMADANNSASDRRMVYRYFGTFSKSMITMFEVTHVNPTPTVRTMIDNVSEDFAWLFIMYRVFVSFAVLRVITAVFIQQTLKISERDKDLLLRAKQKEARLNNNKIKYVFKQLTGSEEGELTKQRFNEMMHEDTIQQWMSAMEIDPTDADELFDLLDHNGDGTVSADEFLIAAGRLRGQAKSLDVFHVQAALAFHLTRLEDQISEIDGYWQEQRQQRAAV